MKIQKNVNLTILVAAVFITSITVISANTIIQGFAQEQDRILVHINSGKPSNADEVHTAWMAMSMATSLQETGKNVTVFLDVNGVNLGVKNPDSALSGVASLVKAFTSTGGKVYVCEHCVKYANFTEQDLADRVSMTNPEKMSKILSGNLIALDY